VARRFPGKWPEEDADDPGDMALRSVGNIARSMVDPAAPPRRKPRFRERHLAPPHPERPASQPPVTPARAATASRATQRTVAAPRVTVEQALYAGIFLAALLLRIWDLGSRAMHGDESVHAWLAWNLFTGAGYQYDPVYHGPLQFPVTALFYFLFGVSNTSARLMAALFGTGLVLLPWFLRPYMGRAAAIVAAGFLAISPAFVYVSRLERDDIFSCFFALAIAIGILGYFQTRQARYVYLIGASLALSLAAMENTYITAFIFGSFLLIVFLSEALGKRLGAQLTDFWRKTGSLYRIDGVVATGIVAALVLGFALCVGTGKPILLLLLIATLLLGMVSRYVVLCQSPGESQYTDDARRVGRVTWLNTATIVVAILILAYSTFGSNLRGVWDFTQPFFDFSGHTCAGNSIVIFGIHLPFNPCRKDIVGGLFYWLSQQRVARGGQPWFYYGFLFALYEQIALLFGVGGILWFLRKPTFFTTLLTYWAILGFGIYSWAGEKFPWLIIHSLLPFTLLAAMFVVELLQLRRSIAYAAGAVLLLLLALEVHSMTELNYVNGADPVEMMVYVQSSPDTPKVAQSILTLSNKVTSGKDLHVTVDSLDTWPFAWYLRDMPNVAYPAPSQLLQRPYITNPVILVDQSDQPSIYPRIAKTYTGHIYRLRWWFPEDYKGLTWSSAWRDAINPQYWSVIWRWMIDRRPFGPKGGVWFYYYVKNGLASPY